MKLKPLLALPLLLLTLARGLADPDTSFFFNGELDDGGAPANGEYNFIFTLFDHPTGGNAVGTPTSVVANAVPVSGGQFVVPLDFGKEVFNGSPRWLRIEVKTNLPAAAHTTLAPRQTLGNVPYAVFAATAGSVADAAVTADAIATAAVTPDKLATASPPTPGQVLSFLGGELGWINAPTGNDWSLLGNGGTVPGTSFLGTTDNVALTLRVNNAPALRLQPTGLGPSLVGGHPENTISGGGSVIAGGGIADWPNSIVADWSAIVGGRANVVQGRAAIIGGGEANHITQGDGVMPNLSEYSVISGGRSNRIANGFHSAIGGGGLNAILDAHVATIAGGYFNFVTAYAGTVGGGGNNEANGIGATVPGGLNNAADGDGSFAAGQFAKALHNRAFVWSDGNAGDFASTADSQFLVSAAGGMGINKNNPTEALDVNGNVKAVQFIGDGSLLTGIVGGGGTGWSLAGNSGLPAGSFLGTTDNQPLELRADNIRSFRIEPNAEGAPNIIVGAPNNIVLNGAVGATISGGGALAYVEGSDTFSLTNQVESDFATIAGGAQNLVGSDSLGAAIGGGYVNTIENDSPGATIGGGTRNLVAESAAFGTVPGGEGNWATAPHTFAAGYLTTAQHEGSFVWADSSESSNPDPALFESSGPFQFLIRAINGVGINKNNPSEALDVNGKVKAVQFIGDGSMLTGLAGWSSTGNGELPPGAFLGTTDNQPLVLKVNNTTGLRIAYGDTLSAGPAPNIIGGSAANLAINAPGGQTGGMTIAGGGYAGAGNIINQASFATISGGSGNSIELGGGWSVISGGTLNSVGAGYAFTGGGQQNEILGSHSVLVGGQQNTNSSGHAFLGGGYLNNNHASSAVLVAGSLNEVDVSSGGSFLGGGYANRVRLSQHSTLVGGQQNVLGHAVLSTSWSFLGGGLRNINAANRATLGGGEDNIIENSAAYATLGGGIGNRVTGESAVVVGGAANLASSLHAVVIGGGHNLASGPSSFAGGGSQNEAIGDSATVSGGRNNTAFGELSFAAGLRAKANHHGAFVWADSQNTDFASTANNQFNIRAQGGVRLNNDTSLHLGNQTRQMINLWDANYGIGVQSLTTYFRSGGGFSWFSGGTHHDGLNNPGAGGTVQMRLDAGGLTVNGVVVSSSDRNAKENFQPVNPRAVLDKVIALPLSEWNYKQDAASRHVGPMAQDFHAAFGLGMDDKHIATVDADGVALAAIQGLNEKLEAELSQKDTKIAELQSRLEALERRLKVGVNGGGQ